MQTSHGRTVGSSSQSLMLQPEDHGPRNNPETTTTWTDLGHRKARSPPVSGRQGP
jgi:hypothetical protein